MKVLGSLYVLDLPIQVCLSLTDALFHMNLLKKSVFH